MPAEAAGPRISVIGGVVDYRDGIFFAGLALIGVGIAMWSRPAALIFWGLCIAMAGLFLRTKRSRG